MWAVQLFSAPDRGHPNLQLFSASDLGGEIAVALAATSIVFCKVNPSYSSKLDRGAATMYKFTRRATTRTLYSRGQPDVEPYYKSTSYSDEYMWSAAWMYYGTGNASYVSFATDPRLWKNARALFGTNVVDLFVFNWDSKVPGAQLHMFGHNTGYPYSYEQSLAGFRNEHRRQHDGMAMFKFDRDREQPLQYVVANAFLAALYADYLVAGNVKGWYCGSKFMTINDLRAFARSQAIPKQTWTTKLPNLIAQFGFLFYDTKYYFVYNLLREMYHEMQLNYILGDNPKKMSYVVGVGKKYPRRLHHRGASTPNDGIKYTCTGGYKWRDSSKADPNLLTGAMVGEPDRSDGFTDSRNGAGGHNEPTLAGNAGLPAALVSKVPEPLT
ncbi:hypothetical protein EJB05_13243, partial [Eragrostis curvula]